MLCSVYRTSVYNLVNETNLVHNLFLVYFVDFIYNLYMTVWYAELILHTRQNTE